MKEDRRDKGCEKVRGGNEKEEAQKVLGRQKQISILEEGITFKRKGWREEKSAKRTETEKRNTRSI